MKRLAIILFLGASVASCGTGAGSDTKATTDATTPKTNNDNPSYDPNRGEGKFTKVDVGATLDAAMAASGEKTYGVKCSSCHKTTDEKLVGPGWRGVTGRNTAEWIMNFVTNTDAMLSICLVRMPNQNLSDDEARALYEFMRKNDGVK
jgi:cytochrome c5